MFIQNTDVYKRTLDSENPQNKGKKKKKTDESSNDTRIWLAMIERRTYTIEFTTKQAMSLDKFINIRKCKRNEAENKEKTNKTIIFLWWW